jgi:hypothetical protein
VVKSLAKGQQENEEKKLLLIQGTDFIRHLNQLEDDLEFQMRI